MNYLPPKREDSLSLLTATPTSQSHTFEGLFELTLRPSRALDLPCRILPELRRNKNTVRFAMLDEEGARHSYKN